MRARYGLHDLIHGIDIGLCGCNDNVGVRPLAIHHPAAFTDTDRDLALGVGAGCDVVHRIKQKFRPTVDDRLYRLEGGIYRTTT